MSGPQRKIFLVTECPPLVAGFLQLLHAAGWESAFSIVSPLELPQALAIQEPCLVVIDAEPSFDWQELVDLRRHKPDSLFVLWSSRVTPEFALAAVDAGVDGLISTKLPLEDASQTLLQICHGERCFRFDAEMERQPLGAARHASRKPFDASWMFTECAPER
jgi:DNA-binding NarL/FixJ family response regulator